MKNMTTEDRVKAAAKYLLKEYNASDEKRCISISRCFVQTTSNKFSGCRMIFDGDREIDFGELSNEAFGSITCSIADAVCAKLRVKKNEIVYRDVVEDVVYHGGWSGWSSKYYATKKILIVRPCKDFFAINKKLKALGLKEIDFKDWYRCDVAGKRSAVFSRDYRYYAEDEAKCRKVLDYLKGKKRLSYKYVSCDDLEDRRRGEEYETEWYGSESRQIQFTDAKGHVTTIF